MHMMERTLKSNLVFRDALMNYRPTWQCWLNVAVTDPCPFYMTLSNAALNYAQARGGDSYGHLVDNFEALEFYNLSLRSVQKRIHDPMDEGVLGGVLGFACRDVCITFLFPIVVAHSHVGQHMQFCEVNDASAWSGSNYPASRRHWDG
jgi:hypothetical protein